MKMTNMLLLLILFGLIPSTFAQSSNSSKEPMIDPNCLNSLEVCQKQAAKREALRQRCAEDPVWCEERRARLKQEREERQALKKQCQANPAQCKELKRQYREKKKEERRKAKQPLKEAQAQWCADNPSDCERWKADKKTLGKECRKMRRQLEEKYPSRPH